MSGGAPCGCGQAACGCCEGISAITPLTTWNRPGLDGLSVRIGSHGSFLATMKARLSLHALGDGEAATRPLSALGVRESDASIGLLDAFATMADILTFYQERIVNEGYLGTATEMRSVHELARLVGYAPRPGVAASAWLSYTLDANVAEDVTIAAGSQVRTVPGPGELPQIFETSENLIARSAWNRLGVRKTEPPRWNAQESPHILHLAGTATRLKPGDPLLVALRDAAPEAWRIEKVEEDAEAGRTRIEIQPWDGALPLAAAPSAALVAAMRRLIAVRDNRPDGTTANSIAGEFGTWTDLAGRSLSDAYLAMMRTYLARQRANISRHLVQVPNLARATRLNEWAAQLDKAAAILAAEVERELARGPGIGTLIGKLSIAPAVPLTHKLQLRTSLRDRFEEAGDAGLSVLARTSPDLADKLAAGLAGFQSEDRSAPPISVYALRLRARVFGHNAPRQRATVRTQFEVGETIRTTEIGEWPIVSQEADDRGRQYFVRREAWNRIDLEGAHDGVQPASWLLVDMNAVPDFPASAGGLPGAAVARTRRSLVSKVWSSQPQSRADYGVTGEVTRVLLDVESDQAGWIRIAPEAQLPQLMGQPVADRDFQVVRGTTIYAASELLELADGPIFDPVCDGSAPLAPIELDGLYLGLEPGRFVMVTGERADIEHVSGVTGVEAAMIAAVVHDVRADLPTPIPLTVARRTAPPPPAPAAEDAQSAATAPAAGNATWVIAVDASFEDAADGEPPPETGPDRLAGDAVHTFVWLEKPLAYCYRRDTVEIHANLVKATHGETHDEALGDGDGARPNQSFTLKHKPLTWLPAPTPAGATEALELFVNDIRWDSVSSFLDLPPNARGYVIRTDHEGYASVVFGDGAEGARLPSGTLNVAARYRSGLGRDGNARAGQISQLVTRPLGVKEVVNPFRATGGADPETRDQARRNAPLATAALGRLVAVRDYADFARTFAGIAKADAIELSDGARSLVHVTVAALDDAPLDPAADLLGALRKAWRELGDPYQAVAVAPRELKLLLVQAGVRIDPDRRWEVVAAAVREALFEAFGFERRELGEGVASSEVLGVIQAVEGVAMVDLDHFDAIPTMMTDCDVRRALTPGETAEAIGAVVRSTEQHGVATRVEARRARREGACLLPAELVLLSRDLPASLLINQLGGGP